MENKIPFGTKNKIRVPENTYINGTVDIYDGKPFLSQYFDYLFFETKADHAINTEAKIKQSSPEGTCYFNSTAGEFQDENDLAVTFKSGERVLWIDLDAITANIDISSIDDLTHITYVDSTINLGSYNLLLGEGQRGELNLSGTGQLSILSSDGLNVTKSVSLSISNSSGDIIINNSHDIQTKQDWIFNKQIGNSLNLGTVSDPTLSYLSTNLIVYGDTNNDELRTYSWDGTDWTQVGNGLSVSNPYVAGLSSTTAAVLSNTDDELRHYTFDGTDWTLDGNSLSLSGQSAGTITSLDSITIAYIDYVSQLLSTYSWDGTDWSLVGSTLNISGIGLPTIRAINENYIVFYDLPSGIGELKKYYWNGSTWTLVGTGYSITEPTTRPGITAIDENTIAFANPNTDLIDIYVFYISSWSKTYSYGPDGGIGSASIDIIDTKKIALIDSTNDELRTYNIKSILSGYPYRP